jgi:hypothetical protein
MRWERLSDYAIRSGDWWIAKFCLGDRCRFTVYHDRALVGVFDNPKDAKACATGPKPSYPHKPA